MLVVPVSEINCRDSRIEYNSNNAIILCNVLSIHFSNSANIANFSQTPITFPSGSELANKKYIRCVREMSISRCWLLKKGSVVASPVHPLGSTSFRWHNGSAHAKRRRHCTLYSYRKLIVEIRGSSITAVTQLLFYIICSFVLSIHLRTPQI